MNQQQILVGLRDEKRQRQIIPSQSHLIEIRIQSFDDMGYLKRELVYMPTIDEAIQAFDLHNSIIHNTHVNDIEIINELVEDARSATNYDGEFDWEYVREVLNDYIIIKRPKN